MNWVDTTAKFIKELFKPKTINEIIAKELREAHIRKLEAESAVEYALSVVQCNQDRIKRLEKRLLEHTQEGDYA